jgi:hypothetical protein
MPAPRKKSARVALQHSDAVAWLEPEPDQAVGQPAAALPDLREGKPVVAVDHGFAIGEERSGSPHCRRHVHGFFPGI